MGLRLRGPAMSAGLALCKEQDLKRRKSGDEV